MLTERGGQRWERRHTLVAGAFMSHGIFTTRSPPGWTKAEMLIAHRNMRGEFSIDIGMNYRCASVPMSDECRRWHEYHETLQRVVDGARANDAACVELAVRYIEQRHIVSGSGYNRTRLVQSLKNADLLDQQKEHLNRHFISIVEHRDFTKGFRYDLRLWVRIASPTSINMLSALARRYAAHPGFACLKVFLLKIDA